MSAREKLSAHFHGIRKLLITDAFKSDPRRADKLARQFAGLYVDFSRHRLNDETISLLTELGREVDLPRQIHALFSGEPINISENRPALHTALRHSGPAECLQAIQDEVDEQLEHMDAFVRQLHTGEIRGSSGKSIDTLIHIGIGGSGLGPRLAVEALWPDQVPDLQVRFVANIDPREVEEALQSANPETTLVIICSKSFTTAETLANAQAAKQWLLDKNCRDYSAHFAAITANPEAVGEFGITPDRVFPLREWIGGRYSVWSAAGLVIAASLGMETFRAFLAGAHRMDEHFTNEPLENNIPVLLGLIDCWNINYFNSQSLAFVPYDAGLALMPEYLSQLIMESNGKSVDRDGNPVDGNTAPVIWGGVGSNAQHAFMQMLHQGTQVVPVEFLVPAQSRTQNQSQHARLFANCLAQAETLMCGTADQDLPAWRRLHGNRPSTIIVYDQLTAETLGMLLALYEHRTFVQACIWGINPFDQWGVEQGKQAASRILGKLENDGAGAEQHPATERLIDYFRKFRR